MTLGRLEGLPHVALSLVWVISFGLPKWAPLPSFFFFFLHHFNVVHVHVFFRIIGLIFLLRYPLVIQNWRTNNDILWFGALPPHTTCTLMVGLCPYIPPLLLGGNNYAPFHSRHNLWIERVGTCANCWVWFCEGKHWLYPYLTVLGKVILPLLNLCS